MKILTAEQMQRVDQRAESEHGVSGRTLMDNAGRAIAETLIRFAPGIRDSAPLVLCGKGNNGGDGVTAARHLRTSGIESRVMLLARADALSGPAAFHLEHATREGITVEEVPDEDALSRLIPTFADVPIVLDAVLGTGLRGGARGLSAKAIDVMNELGTRGATIVSVDIPSGLSGGTEEIPGVAVRADHTIALACPKVPHILPPACLLVGALHVVDIGIPPGAMTTEEAGMNLVTLEDVAGLLHPREADGHKGDFGRLLVVGGSSGKSGAIALACRAALRSGAGLVTAATSVSAQPILAGHLMELMTEALPETHDGTIALHAAPFLRELSRRSHVLAIGPGLGSGHEDAAGTHRDDEPSRLVRELLASTTIPAVLDADALNAYQGRASELPSRDRILVLTPHPGEMARLLGLPGGRGIAQVQADRPGIAREFAVTHACHVVLKGAGTVIAGPDGEVWINSTGNPGMATAGSGDVLTGVIAALLCQGLPASEACRLGVFTHGLAGDLCAMELGEVSLMASDVIESLPEAFRHVDAIGSGDDPGGA